MTSCATTVLQQGKTVSDAEWSSAPGQGV